MKERFRRDSQSLSDSCEKITLDKSASVGSTPEKLQHSSIRVQENVKPESLVMPAVGAVGASVVVASPPNLIKPIMTSAPAPLAKSTVEDVSRSKERRLSRNQLRKSAQLDSETSLPRNKSREELAMPDRAALTSSGDDALTMGRRGSLLGSGSGLLEFLGFRRKSSSFGIASDIGPRTAPARMVVGNYLVARQRDALSQRSLRQEGKMLVVMRLNMNKVDFMVNLTTVTIVEQRGEKRSIFLFFFL